MKGSVTVGIAAPPLDVWKLVADVRNTGRFSPEVFEAEWLDGVDGPELGARFRGADRRPRRQQLALPVRAEARMKGVAEAAS